MNYLVFLGTRLRKQRTDLETQIYLQKKLPGISIEKIKDFLLVEEDNVLLWIIPPLEEFSETNKFINETMKNDVNDETPFLFLVNIEINWGYLYKGPEITKVQSLYLPKLFKNYRLLYRKPPTDLEHIEDLRFLLVKKKTD